MASARATARAAAAAELHVQLSKRCVSLWRRISREVPRVLIMYDVEGFSPASARALLLKNHFRIHSGVTDPRVKEVLLGKGEQELQETLEQWKQKSHLMETLKEVEAPPEPYSCTEIVRTCVGWGMQQQRRRVCCVVLGGGGHGFFFLFLFPHPFAPPLSSNPYPLM